MPEPDRSHTAVVRMASDETGTASPTTHVVVHHHRTPAVEWSVARATGGHMLHLALAQCVQNNVLRSAGERGVSLEQVDVIVGGGFNADATASTGIDCSIELSGSADRGVLTELAEAAFGESTVAAILRRGGSVVLAGVRATDARPPAD